MPPELSEAWIALCASASQLDDVLEAIDWVEPMVDSKVLPAVLAVADVGGAPADAIEPLDDPGDDDADEVENALETGKPLKIDETDIATAVCKTQSPQRPYTSRALTNRDPSLRFEKSMVGGARIVQGRRDARPH
jgi:hypothetical protein